MVLGWGALSKRPGFRHCVLFARAAWRILDCSRAGSACLSLLSLTELKGVDVLSGLVDSANICRSLMLLYDGDALACVCVRALSRFFIALGRSAMFFGGYGFSALVDDFVDVCCLFRLQLVLADNGLARLFSCSTFFF